MPGNSLTLKQERFVQAYLISGNASQAYREAYDTKTTNVNSVWRAAHTIRTNAKVVSRIEAEKARMAEKTAVTLESITEEFEEARALALKIEQPSAAVAATAGKAKVNGVERPSEAQQAALEAGDSIRTVLGLVRLLRDAGGAEAVLQALQTAENGGNVLEVEHHEVPPEDISNAGSVTENTGVRPTTDS